MVVWVYKTKSQVVLKDYYEDQLVMKDHVEGQVVLMDYDQYI